MTYKEVKPYLTHNCPNCKREVYFSAIEKELFDALIAKGIKCNFQDCDNGMKHVDISIPMVNIDIEVDGKNHWEWPQTIKDLDRMFWSHQDEIQTIHIPKEHVLGDDKKINEGLIQGIVKTVKAKWLADNIDDLYSKNFLEDLENLFKIDGDITELKEIKEASEKIQDVVTRYRRKSGLFY